MKRRGSNTLVALSSAAVMTVYAAGFMRTRAAAERLDHASRERPPVSPAPVAAPAPVIAIAPPSKTVALSLPIKTAPIVRADKVTTAEKAQPAKPADPPSPAEAIPSTAVVIPAFAVPAPPPPAPVSASAEVLLGGTELHNGTFLGWGTSRHGDIQASVTIYSGRITAVSIAQCRTRYSCDVIAHLPAKVLTDQTPEKINNVSGATQSVDAFYWAVMDAMSKAK